MKRELRQRRRRRQRERQEAKGLPNNNSLHFLVNVVAVTAQLGREIFPIGEERLPDELKQRLRRRLGSVVISHKKED